MGLNTTFLYISLHALKVPLAVQSLGYTGRLMQTSFNFRRSESENEPNQFANQ